MVTSAKKISGKILHLFKKPLYWIYLFLFYLITGYGFYRTILIEGSSNPSGIANYSVLSMFFLIPILIIGNTIPPDQKKISAVILKSWLKTVMVFCTGLLIYIPFGVIIFKGGTFRVSLFMNVIFNMVLIGLAIISVYLFIANVLKKRILAIACMYGLSVIIIAVELVIDQFQSQVIYKILYAISLSKYCFGLNSGILDWKSVLLFASISALFILLVILINKNKFKDTTYHTRKKTQSLLQFFVAILLSITILYIIITPNGSLYGFDMTPVQFFTTDESAMEYIDTIDQDVTITVLETKQSFTRKELYTTYFVQAERILEGFDKGSDHITLQYVDVQKNPEFLEEYSNLNPGTGDILVTCGEQYKLIKSEELFNFSYPTDQDGNVYMQITSSKAEQEICSAIESVITEESNQIVFLLGNEEHENYKELSNRLEKKGYEVSNINVYEEEIPDAKMAVVFAPSQDYTDTDKLQEYLYNEGQYGRSLLYVANSDCNIITDNLDALLEKWGLTVENNNIVETVQDNFTRDDSMYGLNEYMDDSFISDYDYMENPAVVPYSRNIIVDEDDTTLYYRTLLQSKETSCLTTGNTLIDEKDNYITAAISSYYQTNALGNSYTGISGHVAVIGSEAAFDPDVLEDEQYSNSQYFMDVIDELFGKNEVKIPITNKSVTLGSVITSDTVRMTLMIAFVIVLPVSMLAVGILLYIRKRRVNRF